MILDELVLENFSAYGGRQEITLTPKGKKRRLIIVGALNGRGKTTMLDAIQLALYGNRARISNRGSLAYETYLSRTRHRGADVADPFSVELEFSIHEPQGKVSYRVRRAWVEGTRGVKEVLQVSRNGELDRALTETWAEHIEELLPLEISSLFFFDGEKVESLANPDQASDVISAAVTGLLGLGVIERLQRDLIVIERRKQTEAIGDEADVDLSRFEAQVAKSEEAAASMAQRCAEAQNMVDRFDTELTAAEDVARKEGGDLFERRIELERERSSAEEEVTATNTLLRETASGPLPLALCGELLHSLANSAAGASALEASELRSLLTGRDRDVLDRLRSDLGDDVAKKVEIAMMSDVTQRVAALAANGYQPSLTATRAAAAAEEQIDSARRAMAELLTVRTGSLELVADFDRQLAGVPAEEAIAAVLERRDRLRQQLAEAQGRLGLLSEDRDRAERELELRRADLEKERQAAAMQRMKGSDAVRVVEHATRVRDTLEQLKAQVRHRSISRIEDVVVDCFRKLLGKQNFITKLSLDPVTCEPTLTNKDGQQLHLERLSAGERQLFAVSMLWGLAIVSGRQLPTIIDTPLGRLDSRHRYTLVDRYFPKAAEQVILLSTDKEIDAELAERLAPVTGRWYRVDYENDRETSTISKGYFFEGADDVA